MATAAGMAAGLVQSLIITPVDLLKIRQQLQIALPGSPTYVGPLQLLRQVLRAEGLPGELGSLPCYLHVAICV